LWIQEGKGSASSFQTVFREFIDNFCESVAPPQPAGEFDLQKEKTLIVGQIYCR
jgi:hypothetical protein